jgi:hypothetical protein
MTLACKRKVKLISKKTTVDSSQRSAKDIFLVYAHRNYAPQSLAAEVSRFQCGVPNVLFESKKLLGGVTRF